jgi:translation initiation factor IF-3
MSSLADRYPVNFHIRASFIYLIDQNGKNIGKVHLNDAISMAREAGLDVVQVSGDASRPACKIMDFGKFKYEISKQKSSSTHKTKELFITAHIGAHDLETKINKLKEFIDKKYSVVFGIKIKGRKQRADTDKLKAVLLDCLQKANVKTENIEFQYSPSKITVFLR